MDQIKIGRFIAEMRKEQNLTQREFADYLGISDKTISKWECGNGMPELSFMQPICNVLKINLNELFSGEKLTDTNYKEKAEENRLKNRIDMPIFQSRICAENVTNIPYPTRETAFADFSCGSSNANVLGMEDYYGTCKKNRKNEK